MRINFTEQDFENLVKLYQEDDGLTEEENQQVFFADIFEGEVPRFLYIIHQAGSSFYKIGITNNLEKRINTFRTGNPNSITYIVAVQSDFSDQLGKEIMYLERFLHRNYNSRRISGEWFELSKVDVCKIFLFLTGSIYGRDLEPRIPQTGMLQDILDKIE